MVDRTNDEEWIEIAETGQDEEAALIAGLLQSQDIPVEVESPVGSSPWPENLGAFGVSRVMVPAARADEARELLARREREFREHPLEEVPGPSDDEGS